MKTSPHITLVSLLISTGVVADVRINEIMASNGSTIADEDGGFEDWIELINTSSETIDLTGWGLSDNENNPFKWSFPDGASIAPGEFLLIWASGKNRNDPAAPLHTSYSISAAGEPISLTRPDESQADVVPAIAIPRDISYGRQPDGTGAWFFFDEPSPETANIGTTYNEVLEPPVFSHPGGFYPETLELTLSHPDPAVTILYTLDGSEPHTERLDGELYGWKYSYPNSPGTLPAPMQFSEMRSHHTTGSLIIADRSPEPNRLTQVNTWFEAAPRLPDGLVPKATSVRARAFKEGALTSRTVTHSYFITEDGENPYNLPVISITTEDTNLFGHEDGIYVPGQISDNWRISNPDSNLPRWRVPANYHERGPEWERPVHIELFNEDGIRSFAQNLGARIHGGASRDASCKSLRLYARSRYDTSDRMNHPFFPNLKKEGGTPGTVDQFRTILLRNSGNDSRGSLFKDAMIQEVISHLPLETQAYEPVFHFINGESWGIINLRERLDAHYLASHFETDPDEVAILTQAQTLVHGTPQDVTDYLYARDEAHSRDMSEEIHFQIINQMIDTDNLALYLAYQVYIGNGDWPHNNLDFWRRSVPYDADAPPGLDGRWRWLVYDTDRAFQINNVATNHLTRVLVLPSAVPGWSTELFRSLMDNAGFRHTFINRIAEFSNSAMTPEHVGAVIDRFNARLAPARPMHFNRWRYSGNLDMGQDLLDFATQRPTHIRSHVLDHFGLTGTAEVTVSTPDPAQGAIQINQLLIHPGTPGITDPTNPFPWSGIYFKDVPITIQAVPNPGHRFIGWQELPGEESPEIELTLHEGLSFTAMFEEIAQPFTIHQWDFDDAGGFLDPPFSIVPGAALAAAIELESGAEVVQHPNAAQGFDTPHLRVNNPLGATLTFAMPTTGFEDITLDFLTRRSGQGAAIQSLSHTTNGSDWIEWKSYEIDNDDPQPKSFDFSGLAEANDNPEFAVRITFSQSQNQMDAEPQGGLAGNNRFDDVTLSGSALPGVNLPPIVDLEALPSGIPTLRTAGATSIFDLSAIFFDPDGDPLTLAASSSNPSIATVQVSGDSLSVTGQVPGEATLTIEADDGVNPPVSTSFIVLVYPAAHELAAAPFTFSEWDAASPAMTFPAHMIFLQSEVSDPTLTTELTRAYQIPLADAAVPADANSPYAASSRTRINGLGGDGIAFINTGRGRDVGAALVALDTTGLEAASVNFTAGTLAVNNRIYAIRLQYRVGDDGPFLDVTDALENPVEYIRSTTAGDEVQFGPIPLPADALGEPYVQLQWRYHYLSGSSSRAQLRLDDITVTSGTPATGFAAWRAAGFTPTELDDPAISGPTADPTGSGVPNLLRYALGLDRNDAPHGALPALTTDPAFRFPIDLAKSDIVYRVTASTDLSDWSTTLYDSVLDATPAPEDGHLILPLDTTGPVRFFRLEVEER